MHLMSSDKSPVILPGSASAALAAEISEQLGLPVSVVERRKFSDSETFVKISDNIRGRDVFVVQSTAFPTNDNLMELLLLLDAA